MDKAAKNGKLVTVRFVFQSSGMEPDKIGVKYYTLTHDELDELCDSIVKDPSVKSCYYEYQHEIDLSQVGFAVPVVREFETDEGDRDRFGIYVGEDSE